MRPLTGASTLVAAAAAPFTTFARADAGPSPPLDAKAVTSAASATTTTKKKPRDDGLVGVWLDAASVAAVAARYPRVAGARVVLLQGPSMAGVDAFEPLYGAVASVCVKGEAGGPDADALVVEAFLPGLGAVGAIGLPASILSSASPAQALALVERLAALGVLGATAAATSSSSSSSPAPGQAWSAAGGGALRLPSSWSAMVDPPTPRPLGHPAPKDLLTYAPAPPLPVAPPGGRWPQHQHQAHPPTPLVLTGLVCPAGLYDPSTHKCAWEGPGSGGGGGGGEGNDDKAPSECPLCAFIKGGGCREPFLPFQACIEASAEREIAAERAAAARRAAGEPPLPLPEEEAPGCMHLFGPVVACMKATEQNREYYGGFIKDFAHLFQEK